VRELQKQQSTFETNIRSSNEKKKKADDEVERAEGELNEYDLAVENCKAEIETLDRSRQQLQGKLVQVENEIKNLDTSYQESLAR
jgi:chromosome segregation ATPase